VKKERAVDILLHGEAAFSQLDINHSTKSAVNLAARMNNQLKHHPQGI
jgi:hypothetical protein